MSNLDGLRRSTTKGSAGYLSRRLTMAERRERRMSEALDEFRRAMLRLEAEAAAARAAEDAAKLSEK